MERLGIRSTLGFAAFLVMTGCLAAIPFAALYGAGWAFAAAGLLGAGCELSLHRTEPGLLDRLSRLHVGETLRFELRCVALLMLLARLDLAGHTGLTAAITLVMCLLGGQAVHSAMRTMIRRRRRFPIASQPPRELIAWPGQRMLGYELTALLGLTGTLATGDARWVVAGLTAATGACLLTLLALAPYLALAIHLSRPSRVRKEGGGAVAAARPWRP
ncbi:hypothetical protein [Streptomyces sp. ME19-01-6]|uniref:hypothetical protein n=1 Tax=Streptomyces sp. ME19-01-6 TaxID=3028686 RepID=UPI0029B9D5C3|nr:hypothetical protein [Streptomyces sp. ME19-01-6]MDX3232832.1 hypothetical protein [Streptomyces sp. ME19-01-6]